MRYVECTGVSADGLVRATWQQRIDSVAVDTQAGYNMLSGIPREQIRHIAEALLSLDRELTRNGQ